VDRLLVVLMSFIVFSVVRAIPGDPATILLGQQADVRLAAQIRHEMGLDGPLLTQYVKWAAAALHGDLGKSLASYGTSGLSGQPVGQALSSALVVTVPLTFLAMLIALLVGTVAGLLGAFWRGTRKDYLLSVGTFVWISIPEFYLAILLILFLSVHYNIFPATGWTPWTVNPLDALHHLVLPAACLGLIGAAPISRMLRASMLEVLPNDYIKAARSRGAPDSVVYLKHALRNALLPTITVASLQLGYLLGGAVIVEQIFALPGMGWTLIQAVNNRDYTMIQGVVLVFTIIFALVNLLNDVLYGIADPTVRSAVTGARGAR